MGCTGLIAWHPHDGGKGHRNCVMGCTIPLSLGILTFPYLPRWPALRLEPCGLNGSHKVLGSCLRLWLTYYLCTCMKVWDTHACNNISGK